MPSDPVKTEAQTTPAKYVIINDCDAPEPRMVCQWVPGVGYCYLDRKQNKGDFDGMTGIESTPVDAFGWTWAEDEDGGSWVRFYRTDRPVTATYRDGKPRRWQHAGTYFEFKRLQDEGGSMSDADPNLTAAKTEAGVGTTERGFALMEFKDRNGVDCSLQKSSLAFEDCIWLGCNEIGLKRFTPDAGGWSDVVLEQDGPYGVVHIANTRMHLSREQVAAILPYLRRFVETGELS